MPDLPAVARKPGPRRGLWFAFGCLIAMIAAVGILGLREMAAVNADIEAIGIDQFAALNLAREGVRYSTLNNRITMRIFLLHDRAEIDRLLVERAANTARITELLKQLATHANTDAERTLLANVTATREPYVASYKAALKTLLEVRDEEAARVMMVQTTIPSLIRYHTAWEDFAQYQADETARLVRSSRARYAAARRTVIALVCAAVLCALGIAVFAARRLAREVGTRTQAEAALRRSHEELESRVAARTAELTAEIGERNRIELELAAARDAALDAVRSKSQFLANMSHEIRTPMNGVMGMAGLLLDTSLDREQREFAETIRESGDLLLTIINDILDFSKIEAGKLHFETLDFDVREVVESTLEMNAEKAQAQGLELLGHVSPEIFTHLRGDAGRLRQILTNLLNNAIKFTARGEVVLRVSQPASGLLRFEVQDTGIGISTEAQQHLFQPFNQADGSTTRKYGGTGLGLAIARQLVAMMHGEIGVESTVGQGSTFWFTARLDPQAAAPQTRDRNDLAGLHVLIVDDNATNRHILGLQLSSLRMRCASAVGAREALAILRGEHAQGTPFDLAILDMQMPEMDGLMLAAAIKADAALAGTRLVMLSSLGRHLDTAGFKAAGIEEYLVKPVKQSRLYDCLAEVMLRPEKSPARPQPPAVAVPEPAAAPQAARILLAEDNRINQKVALRQLLKLGYHADAVADGLEVLAALKRIPYDIILMDCQMPELDGYDTTRQIRRDAMRPIHIIAMTAHAMPGDREKCLAAGMDDYLTKPVRTEELRTLLARWQPAARDAPVDFAQLREAGDGDPEEMRTLAALYFEQADEVTPGLAAALDAGSAPEVNALAHKLAGASASCGMAALVAVLRELEQMGRAGDLSAAADCHRRVTAELRRTRHFLTLHLPTAVEAVRV